MTQGANIRLSGSPNGSSRPGIDASIGTVGDAHDNALAESVNGLYKTELIKPRRPWRNANHVEAETATYLDWFNNRRALVTLLWVPDLAV